MLGLACPCISSTLGAREASADRVPAQQSMACAHSDRPAAKRRGPEDAPPAKRVRPHPATPAPPMFALPESDISGSDDDADEDYLPRAKRARPSAAAPAPGAAAPARETRTGLVSPGHAVHWPALAAFGRLPLVPCVRVTARQSRRYAPCADAGRALLTPCGE
jgi:hypothetical protein